MKETQERPLAEENDRLRDLLRKALLVWEDYRVGEEELRAEIERELGE